MASSRVGCGVLLALFGVLATLAPSLAAAEDAQTDAAPEPMWREVWSGARASQSYWLAYTGITVAPTSAIFEDGLRLRLVSGYGGYHYHAKKGPVRVHEQTAFSDALIGYLQRFGPLTAKAFVGISVVGHRVDAAEGSFARLDLDDVKWLEYGPKGGLEFWLNVGPDAWTSLDLSWTSAYNTGAARFRAGYRVLPSVSLGPEAGFDTNAQAAFGSKSREGTLGVFARYEWDGGEVSASGGVAGPESTDEIKLPTSPYGTVNWITQF